MTGKDEFVYKPVTIPNNNHKPPLCTKPKELQVLAFILTQNGLLAWADKNKYLLNEEEDVRYMNAYHKIDAKLPGPRRDEVLGVLVGPRTSPLMGFLFIVGSNVSERDLERSQDRELIKEFQKALGVEVEPLWYLPPFD